MGIFHVLPKLHVNARKKCPQNLAVAQLSVNFISLKSQKEVRGSFLKPIKTLFFFFLKYTTLNKFQCEMGSRTIYSGHVLRRGSRDLKYNAARMEQVVEFTPEL